MIGNLKFIDSIRGSHENRGWLVIVILATLLISVMIVAALIGETPVGANDIWNAFIHWLKGQPQLKTSEQIAWEFRIPRVILASLVGMALAISGTCLQAMFRNPMADPFILGISAGGALGATVAVAAALPSWFLPPFAFVGSSAAVAIVYTLGRSGGVVRTDKLLLTGVALSAMFSAIMSLLLVLRANEDIVQRIYFWLLGGFWNATWSHIFWILPYVSLGLLIAFKYSHPLNALLMGEEWAHYVGVDIEKLKKWIIVAAALSCGAAVAVSGLIGFVGLLCPHIVRLLIGPNHRFLIPGAALMGAILLVSCDIPARSMLSAEGIPVGIFTALIGVPFFLYLLRRSHQSYG